MSFEPHDHEGQEESGLDRTLMGQERSLEVLVPESADPSAREGSSPISVEIYTSYESANQDGDVETSSHYTADTMETGSFHTPEDIDSGNSDDEQPVNLSVKIPDLSGAMDIQVQVVPSRHSPDGGEGDGEGGNVRGEGGEEEEEEVDEETTPIASQTRSFVLDQPKLLLHEPEVEPTLEKHPPLSSEVHPPNQPRQRKKKKSEKKVTMAETTPLLQKPAEGVHEETSCCACCTVM